MKRFAFLLILACVACKPSRPVGTDSAFLRQLTESGFLHSPLPLDRAHSAEAEGLGKRILAEERLPVVKEDWSFKGPGSIRIADTSVTMVHPSLTGRRATGPADDPDYATYGTATACCNLHGRDYSAFNRIVLEVRPECDGGRVCGLNLSFNGHESHLMNFTNRTWNEAYLDLDGIPLESVSGFSLYTTIKGKDGVTGDSTRYVIRNIRFQRVENPERQSGWQPMPDRIIYSMSGYFSDGEKTALISGDALQSEKAFRLVDNKGRTVRKGKVAPVTTSLGFFGVIDFSDFTREGQFRLITDHLSTPPFSISENPFGQTAWRVLNGIFGQRCGYSVPGIHTVCHRDLMAVHDGRVLSYSGGWHDAGDLSQQTLQTGDVTYALLESYAATREKDPLMAARFLEEARWGLEFLQQTRFGDGWRASSMGLLHWTDGMIGTFDDITTVRTQNLAFDNYLLSAYEAYAAQVLPDDDSAMKERLAAVAEEDFAFAEARFAETGFEPFRFIMEHSYNTSHSQYMATVAWSAAQLYRLTGKGAYAERAAEAARFVLDCQQTEPLADGTAGFFWRDRERRGIVHFIHQSREQVFMQALTLLSEVCPEHADAPSWQNAIRLYGEGLKRSMYSTAPYGMVPSGVYADDEYLDTEGFHALHIFAPADAEERFSVQVHNGIPIDGHFYIRRFPVWFNIFNGNNAVLLSSGKSAALCGRFLHDDALLQIGAEQLYWTVGKNPFGQSLIYGEGHRYPQMSAFSSGELTGEMPVGIRSLGDTDEPFWPAVNNACYKEVWVTSSGKWLSLLSEYVSHDSSDN